MDKNLTEGGGLAQLARASALHAEGQRFESVILHSLLRGIGISQSRPDDSRAQ